MKKTTIILTLLLFSYGNLIQAQNSDWYSSTEIDIIFHNKMTYLYADSDNRGYSFDFEQKGFLLKTYAIQYDINYLLFSKLSIGAISGFELQRDPDFPMLKLGSVLRYFLVDEDNANIYVQVANGFSINKAKFKNGVNSRIGISIPVYKEDTYNYLFNVFVQQNFFNMSGADKLIGNEEEFPNTLTTKSFGLSFGIKF